MKERKFKVSEYVNGYFKTSKKPISFFYCDDQGEYEVICKLDWNKNDKDDLINKANNFVDEIKALPKFTKKATHEIFRKYFNAPKNLYCKEHIELRAYRLSKLYSIGCPEIISNNELQLLINLLIINNYALKDSITISDVKIQDN